MQSLFLISGLILKECLIWQKKWQEYTGIANIPNKTPWSAIKKGSISDEQKVLFNISDTLIADGMSQVVNYSFMDKKELKKLELS